MNNRIKEKKENWNEKMELRTKESNKTRLKNLLKKFENTLIMNLSKKIELIKAKEEINNAINLIINNLEEMI